MDNIKKLPKDVKKIWRLSATFDFVIVLLVMAAFLFWYAAAPVGMKNTLMTISMIILAFGILDYIFELALVEYRWNFWTYYIDDRQVELHHGFFFRKQIIIPIARVQNVTLKQGPILRWKDLQKVNIVTAAGHSEISGLKTDEADNLKEIIMKLAREARNDI
ncbi:PH domain-containing protein [Companilactobacillus ginsenosidimutans]|uniref:YdbS-like PH domain-containing protein n=1 Tax=Companilactobacillus ginsenosidimutans TaxID=1007676 RepID=A0A0H4QKU2_9LACO|nr:PH domain-containing protein [Companilactobacillus ginsenosidimutans]AKP67333.1 hypothetical protein ABM34_07125 [Companilactobacillus ginsenosidimutans]